MSYSVLIIRRAQKELAGLPEPIYAKTKFTIQKLGDDPSLRGSRKLCGREASARGCGKSISEIGSSNLD
jgi:mRNA-degrading endonuclease RelE of RelBE toxin-antitoxin system